MHRKKLAILFLLLSFNTLAATPQDVYKVLGLSAGKVTAVSESEDDLCDDGPFKFVGEPGEEVLMVGPVVTFYLPKKEKENIVKADEETCAEDVLSTFQGKKLVMVRTIHSCPKKLQHLNSTTEKSLEVIKNTIKLTQKTKRGTNSCLLNWVANEKK